ncbi:MAG TPA: exosortase H-associated membrane protein [Bryobacteraceae bacterium]|nr:exosortase H-associated membrane protein [Bryobacteraceae bacterium]
MLPGKAQRRFLLRASALLIVFLSVWYFFLQRPLRFALWAAAQAPAALMNVEVTRLPNGDWSFHIPVFDSAPEALRRAGLKPVHTLDFDVAAPNFGKFTMGLPVFWALALAAGGRGSRWRYLVWGSLMQLAIGVVCVLVCYEIYAYGILGQMRPNTTGLGAWARAYGLYMTEVVVPLAAPVITVVWLHPRFKRDILGLEEAARPAKRAKVVIRSRRATSQ